MNDPALVAIYATVISGLVSIVSLAVQRMLDRRTARAEVNKVDAEAQALTKKTDAEAQDLITIATGRIMDRYEKQIATLVEHSREQDVKIANQEGRIAQLEEIARVLVSQLTEAGLVPKVKL